MILLLSALLNTATAPSQRVFAHFHYFNCRAGYAALVCNR